MPRLSFSKYLQNRSRRKQTKENQNNADKTAKVLNDFFTTGQYPFKVIDYVLSVYVTTFIIESTDTKSDILLDECVPSIKKELNVDSLRVIDEILSTGYKGIQLPNLSPFDISYQYCLDRVKDLSKLPLGIDDENELVALSINELGNTLVLGDPNTRKTTFIKSLVTSLILSNDKTNINVILDNSTDNKLSIFEGYTYISKDVLNSLQRIKEELDKREALLNGESLKNYNKKMINDGKNPIYSLNIFIDEYKGEYRPLLLNILPRSTSLGVNIILASPIYIAEFGDYIQSAIGYKISDLTSANIPYYKELGTLLGRGDSYLMSLSLKRRAPLRIVTPYLEDKEIKRLLPH